MLGNIMVSDAVRSLIASMPRGKSRAARLISRRYPRAKVFPLVKRLKGISLFLDTSDPFQAEMAYGSYQDSVINKILELANPGDVVLTAGAQVGYVALALAKAVGSNGRVVAFEADPRMVEACRNNLALNNQHAVELIPFGLGAVNSNLQISISSTPGQSSLAIAHNHLRYLTVPVRNGDEAVAEIGVSKIDGIVLDVEGWETQVLEGLSETLARHLPRWAIIESWDVALRGAGSSSASLKAQLERLGWKLSSIDGGVPGEGDIVCISGIA